MSAQTKKRIRTLAVGAVLAATSAAPASFVGLHLVEHAVDGLGAGTGTTWRLYAEFDDPSDQVTRVHGDWPLPTVVVAMNGFYQNPFAGPMSTHVNAAFVAMFPSLAYDSWVTIGGEWSHESNTLNSTNINFSYFETAVTTPGVLGFINGQWTRPQNDPYAYGVALSGLPNYHVLLGQFTTSGYGTANAPFGVMSLNGYRDGILFNGGGLVEWAADGVHFGTMPSNVGACCVDDPDGAYCQILTESVCAHFEGTWYGQGTSCTDANVACGLDEDAGACCYALAGGGKACEVLTEDQCNKMGVSYWYGPGVMCDDPDVNCGDDQDTGACCYPLGDGTLVCELLTQNVCGQSDGYWYGAGSVCSDPFVECDPLNLGACCFEDPDLGLICLELEDYKCDDLSGTWFGFGSHCTDPDVVCEADTGACCYADPAFGLVCIEVQMEQCDDLNGYWYGSGSVCSDPFVECDELPEDGACCYNDPAFGLVCVEMAAVQCDDLNGYWYGSGSVCSDPFVECDEYPMDGACCYENAAQQLICGEMFQANCDALNGYWYGPGTICSDPFVECDEPQIGACCIEEGQGSGYWFCVEISMDDCTDHLGIWYGVGSLCSDADVNCAPGNDCASVPGSECARAPQYDDAAYQLFGGGPVAVQTAAPNVTGGRMVTVFDLTNINAAPLNADFPINRYAHASWDVQHLGAIFGLALDEAGNIFVSASQTWNNDWAGPAGWGAVYRIDSNTAAVSTFAVLPTTNTSLGSITYDCEHSQLFVSNFEDGLIYRLDYATGAILDTFDHGTPWSGGPGPVALGDRPFAVEVNGDRLYYSMWNSDLNNPSNTPNQIWSVRLNANGRPDAGMERLEINLPEYDGGNYSSPVADLDFSPEGTMILGERSQAGISNMSAHRSRVLEYRCEGTGWVPTAHLFTIGEWPEAAAGGVDGTESNVWASADGMHISSPDAIYGFQGLPASGGSIVDSWLIDYNGNLTNQDKTLLGDLVIAPEGDGGSTGPECPTIGAAAVICISAGPPAEFGIDFSIANADDSDTIIGVSMNVPSLYTLSPANATMNLAPNTSGAFSTVLTGGTPGTMFCIDMEVQFKSDATCNVQVCFALPNCIVIPPGDFDGNGVVNVDDLMILIGAWGEVCDGVDNDCNGVDADGNGVVDMGDLLILLDNWTT